ncbi:MAG: glycosyltransferase family 4 protein, partial [bacterium]|nr:glycosyltransferase family 4 protein [bacterium]
LLFWGLLTLWLPIYLFFALLFSRINKIVVFGAYYSYASALAAKLTGKPIILFLRSLVFEIDKINGKPKWLRSISEFVEKIGMLSARKIVFMTPNMKENVERFLGREVKNFAILPNEISNLSEQYSAPAGLMTILLAGVLDDRKNVAFVIQSLSSLPQTFKNKIQCFIAGDGPRADELKFLTASLNVAIIKFVGWQENMSTLYQKSHIFIHPSQHEGISNAVLEALSYGLDILISDIPEHRMIINHNDYLFSLSSVNELTQKLQKMIEDPDSFHTRREFLRQATMNLRFDWNQVVLDICKDT